MSLILCIFFSYVVAGLCLLSVVFVAGVWANSQITYDMRYNWELPYKAEICCINNKNT
jgi:hypothetical protein